MSKELIDDFNSMYLKQRLIMRKSLLNRPIALSAHKNDNGYVLVAEEPQVLTGRAKIRSEVFGFSKDKAEMEDLFETTVDKLNEGLGGKK